MPPTASRARPQYHHGHLRAALIDAAFELAREGGPDAIVVREASRRVGVSHNAAYRHFPDRESLLAAVGERCMDELAALMQQLTEQVDGGVRDPDAARLRLRATGRAYVTFAITEPGLFRTGFTAVPGHDGSSPVLVEAPADAPPGPFQLLIRALDELDGAGGIAPGAREHAEHAAWSAVHGFSMLCLEGPLRLLSDADREAALEAVLTNVERGLASDRSS
jgi:AcrR family transcriptional regulator